jgi:hypothetical protein
MGARPRCTTLVMRTSVLENQGVSISVLLHGKFGGGNAS